MSPRFETQSIEAVANMAESLRIAAEQLEQVASLMRQHGLSDALFPWTTRQWNCLDAVITLAFQCRMVLPAQIDATQKTWRSKFGE